MNIFFLNIAGFIIKLNFTNTGSFALLLIFEKFKNEILNLCGGFIEKEKVSKVDFNIDFIYKFHEVTSGMPTISKGKLTYHPVYEKKGPNRIEASNESSTNEFQIILWYVLRTLLQKKGGFFLHASAVNIDGMANIFLGESGGGKSTAMNLLRKNYLPLSDDVAIIKKIKKEYYFYQTPFLQKEFWYGRSSREYHIKKVFFLQKANFFKIEKINNKELLLKKVIKQLMARTDEELKAQVEPALDFIANFDEFYTLYFAKNEKEIINLFRKNNRGNGD